MDINSEYVSFKKVIVFGDESTGKSTIINMINNGSFTEQEPSKNNIYNFY